MPGTGHTWVDGDFFTAARGNALPRGVMGVATQSSAVTGVGATVTDIPGCSVTFTAIASRYYKTTLHVPTLLQSSAAGDATLYVTDAGGSEIRRAMTNIPSGGRAEETVIGYETGLSGAVTRKGRVSTSAGTVATVGGTSAPMIIVEDMGP